MNSAEDSDMPKSKNCSIDIDKYRGKVRFYMDANANESALFWADKVATLSNGDPQDIYWLAQCMYRSHQYHRAAMLIRNKGLDKSQPLFQWLAGLSLFEAKEYNDALLILTEEDSKINCSRSSTSSANTPQSNSTSNCHLLAGFTPKGLQSALQLLKGQVYERLNNHSCAADCFKQALKNDVYCYEAFQALVKHQMLTAAEEKELLFSLPFKEQCEEHDLLPTVYEILLNKYQSPSQLSSTPSLPHPRLSENLDLEVARAEKLYYTCAYRQCFSLTEDILKKDPYHTTCLPIHISCLVELRKVNKLFYLAHDLVDLMPDKAVSWFAVGCYYYVTEQHDPARRYLGKATALDTQFGPAWLAYGHSFAAENEHDQAMATYFSATKLMKGCHLPMLYIGLECGLTNNVKLAERFFTQAQSIAPHDPFVIHEMGIIAFQNKEYNMAEKHFLTALSQVHEINQSVIADKWEPLLNNLGHTCRKLKKYNDALRYHQQALVLRPQNASTLSCIGFVQALQNNLVDAVETFHKALALRRDDSFSISMLSYVIEQLTETTPPFHGAPESIPGFDTAKFSPGLSPEESLTTPILVEGNRNIFEDFTPSSNSPTFEIEMQDSFHDENTS